MTQHKSFAVSRMQTFTISYHDQDSGWLRQWWHSSLQWIWSWATVIGDGLHRWSCCQHKASRLMWSTAMAKLWTVFPCVGFMKNEDLPCPSQNPLDVPCATKQEIRCTWLSVVWPSCTSSHRSWWTHMSWVYRRLHVGEMCHWRPPRNPWVQRLIRNASVKRTSSQHDQMFTIISELNQQLCTVSRSHVFTLIL